MGDMIYTDYDIEGNKLISHTHTGLTGFVEGRDTDLGDRAALDRYRFHYHAGGVKKIYLPTYIGNWIDHDIDDHTLTKYPSYDDVVDRGLIGSPPNYATVHDATEGNGYFTNGIFLLAYQGYWSSGAPPSYKLIITRGCISFDTSSIDAGATLTSATLKVIGAFLYEGTGGSLVIQSGYPDYPHMPPVQADYNKTNYSGDYGSISGGDWQIDAWNEIVITDLSIINKGGITKFVLRTSEDIAGTDPGLPVPPALDNRHGFAMYSGNSTMFPPILTVR